MRCGACCPDLLRLEDEGIEFDPHPIRSNGLGRWTLHYEAGRKVKLRAMQGAGNHSPGHLPPIKGTADVSAPGGDREESITVLEHRDRDSVDADPNRVTRLGWLDIGDTPARHIRNQARTT